MKLKIFLITLFGFVSCVPKPTAGEQPPMSPNDFIIQTVFFILAGIAVFWIIYWKPEQEAQKKRKEFKDGLKRGVDVRTSGGLLGKVVSINGDVVTVEVAQNTKVRVLVQHVHAVESAAVEKSGEVKGETKGAGGKSPGNKPAKGKR